MGDTTSETLFDWDPIYAQIVPSESSYMVLGTKIELKLKKEKVGLKWPALEKSEQEATAMASVDATSVAHSYPSSSKKKADWNKLDKSVEDDKVEGDQALNKLFQDIFANGSDETKKAMMKSFTESGGTHLSTNWGEVGKGKVPISPPDGMVPKAYEK